MMVKERNDAMFDLIEMSEGSQTLCLCPKRGNIIQSWKLDGVELIFLKPENYQSRERPTCGCPILFPFCGRNEKDRLLIDHKEYETGIHGVVHTNEWIVFEESDAHVRLMTASNAQTKLMYPFDFTLYATLHWNKDHQLVYELAVENHSDQVMPCDFGLHPFFRISDLENLTFSGVYEDGSLLENTQIIRSEICANGMMCKGLISLEVVDHVRHLRFEFKNDGKFQNILIWSGDPQRFLVVEMLSGIPNAINMHQNTFNVKPQESVQAMVAFGVSYA